MKGHSVVGCKAIHVRERPEVKADKNRVQAAPVTKVIATVIVQETIIYARYSGPCNNTSPTKFPNGSRRNISKDQTIRMGCQGVYSSRTVYVHVHPNQGARICPTQQLIASKGSARVTKLGDAVKNKMTVNAHTLNATENRGRSRNVVEQHCNCNHANRKWSGMTKNKNVKHTNESP